MYYNIRLDWDPKVIGVKNGVYQVELNQDEYSKEAWAQLNSIFNSNGLKANHACPEIEFEFYFRKLKSAKMTSFMSFSPNLNHCHFLIQHDTLELFKSFSIQPFLDFKAEIYDSSTEKVDGSFRIFYSVFQNWNVIDFERTVFTSGGFGNNPKIEHTFRNEYEMKNFNGIANVKTLVLSNAFDSSLDFFHTRLGGLFVSEQLKLALEGKNITGVKFNSEVQVLM